ncbi:LPS export ABC transporter periplasmic protein LptC [Pedobacter metabolipauper]|uniref:Lipopolysaccharide-assembly LptC-related protein n=1 Tax=Pedobacter metabolipauper TaxID=425513 RepID=A0A4R6SWT8_9SPHI|nr:LPS export ABC transporter periplasmic protein LptC [Pedobacter metabolipauper]TDQ09866.1 lipopolysaccharide-assembly LptC-related protein [Pedobacter metabolipauper]
MRLRGIIYSSIILCFLQVCLSSCGEDDLKNAPKLSDTVSLNTDRTLKVDIIYSDSAKVKAQGFAPILDKVTPLNGSAGYQEMPKGVKINFYSDSLTIKGSITSDYAIMRDLEKTATFRRNVVVVNESMTFNTEELIWDQNKKMFFSPKGIVTRPDGTVLNAVKFTATEDFSTITYENASGEIYVPENFGQ